MNAYQILGIISQIDTEMDEKSANNKISTNVMKYINSYLEEIKRTINDENIGIDKKVNKINENILSAMRVVVSYIKIDSKDKRIIYNASKKSNIDDEINCIDKCNKLQGKDAYEMLNVSKGSFAYINSEIANNVYNIYTTIMCECRLEYMEKSISTIINLKKYAWAFNKIYSEDARELYNIDLYEEEKRPKYKQLCIMGDQKIEEIGKANILKNNQPSACTFNCGISERYSTISVINTSVIEYGFFMIPNEKEIKQYRVIKQMNNGTTHENVVFTNIDYCKLYDDIEYRKNVVNNLLSDCSITMGRKYLAGYIGKINKIGNIEFDIEDIAICKKIGG